MKTLSKSWLNEQNASEEKITFFENNGLIGMPLYLVSKIKGDHIPLGWLRDRMGIGKYRDIDSYVETVMLSDNVKYQKFKEFETWTTYDNNGNIVHFKDSNGFEHWDTYNDDNQVTHTIDSDKLECFYSYPTKNEMHYKDSNGCITHTIYDGEGREIYVKFFPNKELFTTYNSNGHMLHAVGKNDGVVTFEASCTYDDRGNLIHGTNNNDIDMKYEYIYKNSHLNKIIRNGEEILTIPGY